MYRKRMAESTINASLDAYLHGAKAGDVQQARQLHEMLDLMLTEQERPEGKLWLTEHGKMMLAEMHRQLSHCEGTGSQLSDTVLDAVQLKPSKGLWRDTCSYVHDLKVAIAVASELCEQKDSDQELNLTEAARAVANRGEFDLDQSRICEIYDEVASTVGGFKEFSHC